MSSKTAKPIFIAAIIFICVCVLAGVPLFSAALAAEFTVALFDDKGKEISVTEVAEGFVITTAPETEDPSVQAIWHIGSPDGTVAAFPYTVTEAVSLYAEYVTRVLTVSISSGTATTTLQCTYGATPELPAEVEGYSVAAWYSDSALTLPYTPSALYENITLYPLFSNRTVTVTIDGVTETVAYGSVLAPPADTDTHRFVKFLSDDHTVTYPITAPITVTSVFERTRYRITVGSTTVYVNVGDKLTDVDLNGLGEIFFLDSEHLNSLRLPYAITDDMTVYADYRYYNVNISCAHATANAPLTAHRDETVSVKISDIDSGYAIDTVTVTANDQAIDVTVTDDTAVFTMPAHAVNVKITFVSVPKPKAALETKEIVAIVLTSVAVAVAGVFFVIKMVKKKKQN